ncbi:hypothetical protein ACFQRB_10340 [Halobaculum litoreum]|uniref:Uncharacterized protein n=1 Tax=Halobaculum litoreum TaxID=3031998 RepID=A0ABD5XTD3_9EURY
MTLNATSTPITYSHEGTTVASTYGAVVRDDPGGAVMRDGPGWVVDDHTLIPLVIAGRTADRSALGGSPPCSSGRTSSGAAWPRSWSRRTARTST